MPEHNSGDTMDREDPFEKIARLEEALRFYADKGNYVPAGIAPTIWQDNGSRARQALHGA